ncbi:MAG: MFS transporter [Thermomicrobiales bacterium]|nr:MFS transporter [Thermomicrobiales bacterium]
MRAYWQKVVDCGRDIHLFLGFALLSFIGIGVFTLIFNLYLVQLGYDEGFIGAVNGIYTLSMGITCLLIGFLINRFGNWICLTLGTIEFAISMVVLATVTSESALLILAAMNGIGSAFIMTGQMPFVIEWTPRQHTALMAALSSAISSGSIMLGSLVGGLLPSGVGALTDSAASSAEAYRWTLIIGAGLTAISIAPLLVMGTARQERHHEDFRVSHAQLLSHRVRRQARRDVGSLMLLGLFLALGVGAVEPFYNVLLTNMGTPAGTIGLIFALSGLAATVLSVAGPALAARIGYVSAQIWTRVFFIPVHLALIPFPTAWLVSLGYAGRKDLRLSRGRWSPAHAGGLLPPQARAHAFGLRSASWNIGYAIAAFISGQIIARTGSYTPAYLSLSVFCILSVAVYVIAFGGRLPDDGTPATGTANPPAIEPLSTD